ncbi:MAG: DUF4293 domain-containing protein [Rikenellaceae bacterium]
MIQRIQTIYLFLASLLVALSLFMPLAFFAASDQFFNLHAIGLKGADGEVVQSTIYMFVLLTACAILPFVTIFLYNNRMLQIRLCCVEAVLLIGANIIMGVYFFLSYRVFAEFEISTQGFKPALMFPLVAIFFIYLAGRGVMADEIKVRSIDRIR